MQNPSNQFRRLATFVFIVLISQLGLKAQDLRGSYNFQFGSAWSSTVELPKYDLLNIGADRVPIGVNDDGVALLRDSNNRLLKWSWGNLQLLWEPFSLAQQGFLNENGTVVASDYQQMGKRLMYWLPHDTSARTLDVE